MPDAVLVHHAGARWVFLPGPGGVEVVGQVIVDEVDDIHLSRMPGRSVGSEEVLRIASAGKLDEQLVDGVVLVVAPVDLALAEPVAPVHAAVVALGADRFAVRVEEVLRPGVVLAHLPNAGGHDGIPHSRGDGLGRIRGRDCGGVGQARELSPVTVQVDPDVPLARLSGAQPVAVALEQILILVPGLHEGEVAVTEGGEEPQGQPVIAQLEALGPLLPEVA